MVSTVFANRLSLAASCAVDSTSCCYHRVGPSHRVGNSMFQRQPCSKQEGFLFNFEHPIDRMARQLLLYTERKDVRPLATHSSKGNQRKRYRLRARLTASGKGRRNGRRPWWQSESHHPVVVNVVAMAVVGDVVVKQCKQRSGNKAFLVFLSCCKKGKSDSFVRFGRHPTQQQHIHNTSTA
jgi:hypothetical protein